MKKSFFINGLASAFLVFFCVQMAWSETVLIAHPKVAHYRLTTTDLARIYAMQKRVWPDGSAIVPMVQRNQVGPYKDFVNHHLRMQPYQLERVWHRLVFSGTGKMPLEVSRDQEMVDRVASTPGAIGYISIENLGMVDDSMRLEIKDE